MNKVLTGLLGLGLVAGGAALGGSYYLGQKIEQGFHAQLQQWHSPGLKAEVQSYQRGLLSAQAQTLWTLNTGEEVLEFTAQHNIQHGPWPQGKAAKVHTRLGAPKGSSAAFISALQDRPLLEGSSTFDWSGASQHLVNSPSLQVTLEDDSRLSWGGMQSQWNVSADQNLFDGWAKAPALGLKNTEGVQLQWQDMAVETKAAKAPNSQLWTGPASFTIATMTVTDADNPQLLQARDIRINTSTELEGQSAKMLLDMQAAQATLNDGSREHEGKNLGLSMQLSHLDTGWLEQFNTMLYEEEMQSEEAFTAALLASLPQLLRQKPELAITRLGLETVEGPVNLQAQLRYTGGEDLQAFNPDRDVEGRIQLELPKTVLQMLLADKVSKDYRQLLQSMNSDYDEEELAEAIGQGVAERLNTMLERGLLQQQAQQLRTELEYANGRFILNSKPMELHELMGIGGVF